MRLLAAAAFCAVVDLAAVTCAPRGDEAQTPAAAPTPASVTEVSLERRCMGCDREMKLTLRRDGTATKTMFGNARRGTVDRLATAAIAATAFDELAAATLAAGFFQLKDEYRDPDLADGESMVTTVLAAGMQKTVLDRHGKGPEALKRLEARIERLGDTLAWKTVG